MDGQEENGDFISYANYKNGLKHGIRKYFDRHGKLEGETNYKNGLEHGSHKYYDKGGKLSRERYIDGNRVKSQADRANDATPAIEN